MINIDNAPNLLQVIIKVPSYNADGRRYYTNMNVPKDKAKQIIELIEKKTIKVPNDLKAEIHRDEAIVTQKQNKDMTLKKKEKVSVKPNTIKPKKSVKETKSED
jgi:hypothetical protein